MAVILPLALGGCSQGCAHGLMLYESPAVIELGAYIHSPEPRGNTSTVGPRWASAPLARYHLSGAQLPTIGESNGISVRYSPCWSISPSSESLPTYTSAIPPPGASERIAPVPVWVGVVYSVEGCRLASTMVGSTLLAPATYEVAWSLVAA